MASSTERSFTGGQRYTSEAGKRPSFSSSLTSDRLRESSRKFDEKSTQEGQRPRRSVFREVGLENDNIANVTGLSALRQQSGGSVHGDGDAKENANVNSNARSSGAPAAKKSWLPRSSRPVIKTAASAPPSSFSSLPRVAMLAFLIAVVVPGLRYRGSSDVPLDGVGARVTGVRSAEMVENGRALEGRADSPTDVCTRWSHQSAVVNGTLYVYGGRAKTESGQTNNTWNNDFLTLDLTKTWQISSPSLTGLPQPSGPPAIANGYLWSSLTSLFLYGGEFSDTPPNPPTTYSTWEYSLTSKSWTEHSSPTTTSGNNSAPANAPIQRSAEGAGLSVPELGLSWYFGGHLDMWTTEGWSNQVERVYLRSLLEFTHPGYMNDGVEGLSAGQSGAPDGGAYRNITEGGIQEQAGFTERADGVLVYVPGWGTQGIVLGLAGGTNDTFTEMNVIDIYDIASSTWYKQPTTGTTPGIRVNPCAVVFAAPDASSFNIYLYGGQNLQPAGAQTQYDDLWILTIPSFTWIQADLSGQSNPPARAGHTCHAWDGQIVVVGGYVGTEISCDSPGVYVFNASSLQWMTTYTSLSSSSTDQNSGGGGSSSGGGDQNKSPTSPLTGSYAYEVPAAIQSVIGGSSLGGATVTVPAAGKPTSGPIATGHPPVFTVTQSGSTIVETSLPTSTSGPASPANSETAAPIKSRNTGAIAAGVIAGALGVLAAYLAFCTWLYRRQLAVYKNHVAMSQRTALGWSASPDNSRYDALGGGAGRGEKLAVPGAVLGAFGTDISGSQSGGSGSAGRPSLHGSSQSTVPQVGAHGQSNSLPSMHGRSDSFNARAGLVPPYLGGGGEGTEYLGGGYGVVGGANEGAVGIGSVTTNSSTEDLLGGQEPSFIQVVMSPRRTLRVINRD